MQILQLVATGFELTDGDDTLQLRPCLKFKRQRGANNSSKPYDMAAHDVEFDTVCAS